VMAFAVRIEGRSDGRKNSGQEHIKPLAICLQVNAVWNRLSSCIGQLGNKKQHEKTSIDNDEYRPNPDERGHLHLLLGRHGDSDGFV
jgi:hypothetical protein